jgi:hypothetical protein
VGEVVQAQTRSVVAGWERVFTLIVVSRLTGRLVAQPELVIHNYTLPPLPLPTVQGVSSPPATSQRSRESPPSRSNNHSPCGPVVITSTWFAAAITDSYLPPQLTSQAGPTGFTRRRFALAHIPSNASPI